MKQRLYDWSCTLADRYTWAEGLNTWLYWRWREEVQT